MYISSGITISQPLLRYIYFHAEVSSKVHGVFQDTSRSDI